MQDRRPMLFQCEVEAMEACVFDGADPVVSMADSRCFLKTILALYESAETGKVVRLDGSSIAGSCRRVAVRRHCVEPSTLRV